MLFFASYFALLNAEHKQYNKAIFDSKIIASDIKTKNCWLQLLQETLMSFQAMNWKSGIMTEKSLQTSICRKISEGSENT